MRRQGRSHPTPHASRPTPHAPRLTPHAPMTLGANHVSRAPESGWPIPLLVISGLATGPPAGVGDGLRFLSRRCQHICPRSGRFVCLNSAFSRHFYTFYGPSVQAMDAQLKALPTLPVRARTVSGCVNSANLNISQHFTVHLFQSMDTHLGARQGGRTPAVHRDRPQRFEKAVWRAGGSGTPIAR